VEWTA